jgi:hypothetical protein
VLPCSLTSPTPRSWSDELGVKPLRLNYLQPRDWRSPRDRAFLSSATWKALRRQVLDRDGYACVYCGHSQARGMEVNHIYGHHDQSLTNLETVCPLCHRVLHAGLFAAIYGSLLIFARAGCDQNEIIRRTWRAREEEKLPDRLLMERLGLADPKPFRMDREYLAPLYGYVIERYRLLETVSRRSAYG